MAERCFMADQKSMLAYNEKRCGEKLFTTRHGILKIIKVLKTRKKIISKSILLSPFAYFVLR